MPARVAANIRASGERPELDARVALDHGRPRVGPSMTQNSGLTGSSTRAASYGRSCSKPQASMPISRRRPPLAAAHQQRPAPGVEVAPAEP